MAQRQEPTFDDLEPRSREVLREIVAQYVSTGEPISSRSLARCGRFALSPASLRNVMADLEDLGFVYQPHTSAGRVPTDRGYRFFINHLMKSRRLTSHEQHEIDEAVSHSTELDGMMHLASRLLSRLSNQIGVVFTPTIQHLTMRSVDFVLVGERRVLCVIVGANGVVVNKVIEVPRPVSRDELHRISRYITSEYFGMTLDEVRVRLMALLDEERSREDPLMQRTVEIGVEAMAEAMPHENELVVEGAASLLDKPEFADAQSMRRTFLVFQEKERLVEILNQCLTEEGLQILIGSESQFTRNYNFSLIATRYGSPTTPFGLVGIIGPTRMEYGRLAPIVDYLGRALSRKIKEDSEEERQP